METWVAENDKERLTREALRAKNLTALAIVLAGLFVGSLAVDFVQLVLGRGFSNRAVQTHDVLEGGGKTWVAYSDPKVSVTVLSDKECTECDASEALVWLRRVVPTLEVTQIESTIDSGRALIERFHITTLPAFIFSPTITQTDFYTQASSLFDGQSGQYFFDMTKIGLPVGKYLQWPTVSDADIVIGHQDAKVRVVVFSDFQCPFCKGYHTESLRTVKSYGDQVAFVYKHLPLSFHTQAKAAALAAECANEQGKFETYADNLFARQDVWGKTIGTQKFKDYAWMLKLDGRRFTQCLDTKKYANKVDTDIAEAGRFGIEGTPGTFVNGTFLNGAVPMDVLKSAIDKELAQ